MTTDVDGYIQLTAPIDGVRLLTLTSPEELNALSRDRVVALRRTLDEIADDESCRVLVITGAGRGFCGGMNVKSAAAERATTDRASNIPLRLKGQEMYAGLMGRIRSLPQPVIAAVNGAAAGAGFAMTLSCDVRVAAESARFHVAAIKIGFSAGESGISYLLPRLIGASRAFEIMLTGRPFDANEAERYGVVSRVVPDGEVVEAALDVAKAMLANPPFAVAMTKQIMWSNLDVGSYQAAIELENRTQILAGSTDDNREAIAAFAEKRTPTFRGR
ncbi:MAG: enoyl-CoA hydratase/isomerase family protein [Acidimicrobiia bacterium]